MATLEIPDAMNEQQIRMLRLFKNPMPEEDFLKIRRLAIELLGKQLDGVMREWEEKNNITEEYYEQLSESHFRRKSQ